MVTFWVYDEAWNFLGTLEADGYHHACELADYVFGVKRAFAYERPLHMLAAA